MAIIEISDGTNIRGKTTQLFNLSGTNATGTLDVSGLAGGSSTANAAKVKIVDVAWSTSGLITIAFTDGSNDDAVLTLNGNGNWKELHIEEQTATRNDIKVTSSTGSSSITITLRKVAGFTDRTDYSG